MNSVLRLARSRSRPFHVIFLPSLWLAEIVAQWCLTPFRGDAVLEPILAGIAGYWLPGALRLEGSAWIWGQCAGGAIVMTLAGFVQDRVRTKPLWVLAYAIGPVLTAIFAAISGNPLNPREVLFWGSICIYIVVPLSYIVALSSIWKTRRETAPTARR